jgi:thiol-disulfide isomerase/thioredoxin
MACRTHDAPPPLGRAFAWIILLSAGAVGACAPAHGRLTSLSTASRSDYRACEHQVPEEVCVRCHPELAGRFKSRGDWCGEHDVPESQCLRCHPDLDFSPPHAPPPGADVRQIVKSGEALRALEPHLAPGKVTVFDFYATWCPPCRKVDEHLYPRLGTEVAVRKVDVGSWDSPVAEQWLTEVPELPYLLVYDAKGRRRAAISGANLPALDRALEEAKR